MFVVRNTADNSQFWNNDEGWVGPVPQKLQ